MRCLELREVLWKKSRLICNFRICCLLYVRPVFNDIFVLLFSAYIIFISTALECYCICYFDSFSRWDVLILIASWLFTGYQCWKLCYYSVMTGKVSAGYLRGVVYHPEVHWVLADCQLKAMETEISAVPVCSISCEWVMLTTVSHCTFTKLLAPLVRRL